MARKSRERTYWRDSLFQLLPMNVIVWEKLDSYPTTNTTHNTWKHLWTRNNFLLCEATQMLALIFTEFSILQLIQTCSNKEEVALSNTSDLENQALRIWHSSKLPSTLLYSDMLQFSKIFDQTWTNETLIHFLVSILHSIHSFTHYLLHYDLGWTLGWAPGEKNEDDKIFLSNNFHSRKMAS